MSETKTYYATNMNPPILKVGGISFRRYPDGSVMIRDIIITPEDIPAFAIALLGAPTPEMIERAAEALCDEPIANLAPIVQDRYRGTASAVLAAAFGLPA